MNTRILFRWTLSVVAACGLLGVIGLALNPPAQAHAMGTTWIYPGCAATLQACVDAAQAGDAIQIQAGVYTESVALHKPVSLLGAGPSVVQLSALPGQRVLSIDAAILPITASTVISGFNVSGGSATATACPEGCGGGMLITGTARPVLQNLEFYSNSAGYQGGGLWVSAGTEIQLLGVTFISNTSVFAGGGLYSEAPVMLENADLASNQSAQSSGGGAYVAGPVPNLTAIGTTFSANRAYSYGGGASVSGTAVLTGSSLSNNIGNSGGGLYAGALVLTNTSLSGNSATGSNGGGAWVYDVANLTDSRVDNNTAYGSGAGLYAGRLGVRGGEFTYNLVTGTVPGGGAFVYTGTTVIENALFDHNSATGGGALYLVHGSTRLTNVTVSNNSAVGAGSGGGVYASGPLNILGGVYQNNSSTNEGGGIYVIGSLQLSQGRFQDNASQSMGGALHVSGGLSVTNTRFINNTAVDGSAIWQTNGDGRVVNSLFARNNTLSSTLAELSINAPGQFTVLYSTFAYPQWPPASAINAGPAALHVTDTIMVAYANAITTTGGTASEDYNLYFGNDSNWAGAVVTGMNSITETDPLFVDPSADDYHLQTHSPAIDKGVNVGVNFDIDNQPRPLLAGYDIGFDEMGSLIQRAIDDAAPGDTVAVAPGIYTESLRLEKPVNLVGGDAQTTIINALPEQRALLVNDPTISATTVISGLTFQHGAPFGSWCNDACGGGILLVGTARPQLRNIVLRENQAYQGGGLWVDSGPEIDLNNVDFIGNVSSDKGGGLYANPPFQALNSRFENNASDCEGGGAFGWDLAALDDVTFSANSAGTQGGGLEAARLIMTDGLFLNNFSGSDGGGAYLFQTAVAPSALSVAPKRPASTSVGLTQITGGQFTGNQVAGGYGGGGLYTAGNAQISGTLFSNNTSAAHGGGAFISGGATIENAAFFTNTAAWYGGGLVVNGAGYLSVNDFIGNQAGTGGGLAVGGSVDITASHFIRNQTIGGNGGGLYVSGSTHVIDTLFARNSASGTYGASGGGAYASSYMTVENTAFLTNTADWGGGLALDGPGTVNHANFVGNEARQSGGGLTASNIFDVNASRFISNRAVKGGGFYSGYAGPGRVTNSLFTRNQGDGSAMEICSSAQVDVLYTTIADTEPVTGVALLDNYSNVNLIDSIIAGQEYGVTSYGVVTQSNNLYFNNQFDVSGNVITTGLILTGLDPRFVNPAADDYHLGLASAAINQGMDVGVYTDIDGQPRPIGLGLDIGFDELAGTIQEAIDAAQPGGTVIIPPGIYTESLTLYKPVSLVGAGAGSTLINASANDRVLTVTGNAILSNTQIASLTLQGGRLLTDTCSGFCAGGGVLITAGAQPSFYNVALRDNQAIMGGGMYVQTGGAQLFDSSITGNLAQQSGGGAYVEAASANLKQSGGTVSGNQAIDGAGVFVQDGAYNPFNLLITGNQAGRWGGGLLVGGTGHVALNVTTVYSNSATEDGGGVFVDMGSVEMLSGSIVSNTSIYGGGVALWQPSSTFTQTNGVVAQNEAGASGGGYYLNQGRIVLASGSVNSNRAMNGAGLYINGGQVQLRNTATISGNVASAWGGGVYVAALGSTLTQLGGSIQGNTAPNGGGVKITAGTYELWAGQLLNNSAGNWGGGVLLYSGDSTFAQHGGVVVNNSASEGGGVYMLNGATTIDAGALIYSNTASLNGGGLYLGDGAVTLNGEVTNNRAQFGGGVYINSPTALYRQGGLVRGNTAQNGSGGGVYMGAGTASFVGGHVLANVAQYQGGGVLVAGGSIDLLDTLVLSNTATDGAGLYVSDMAEPGGALRGGLVQANQATGYGGGVYLGSQFGITGTRFFLNSAYDGSAVEITGTADSRLVNAFIGENEANGAPPSKNASVRFDSSGTAQVLHTTFGNTAVPMMRALAVNNGTVTVVNTIVASYTIGLSALGGSLTEDYNLYFQTPITTTGSLSWGTHSLQGLDPLLKNSATHDYHLKGYSPAVNAGTNVGVLRDIDLDARPLAGQFDIGADEAAVASTNANPLTQTTFTYTTPQYSAISLVVPPGAVTETVPLYCSLVQSNTTPLSNSLSLAGFMFELDAQQNPLSNTLPGTINFNVPVTLTVSYTDQELAAAHITDESTMKLYRYEASIDEWKPIGYRSGETQTLDVNNNLITATVLGFSKFGRLGAQGGYTVYLPTILR